MPRPAATATVLGALALAAVTLAHPSASRMLTWPWAAGLAALWLLPVVFLLGTLAAARVWRLPPPLLTTGALGLALTSVVAAVASPFASASLPRIWPTVAGVAVFFLLHHALADPVAGPGHARLLARLAAAFGGMLAFVALLGWSHGRWPLPWGNRNTVPFGHSTYTAAAMVLALPWLLREAADNRGLRRGLLLALGGASLVVLAGTSSRGGVLGLCVAAGLAAAGLAAFAPWSRARKLALGAALLGLAALAVATNPRLRDLVLHQRWSEGATESNVQREAMLRAGVLLGAERPALGWGPGSVPLAYPRVRARLDGGVENIAQLHNTPLQLWATTGTAGLAALALLAAGAGLAAWRARRSLLTLAAVASLGGGAAVALTDHALDLPFFVAFLAANAALLSSAGLRTNREVAPSPRHRRLAVAGVAVVVALPLPATLRELRAGHAFDRALTALAAGHGDEARAALEAASALAPHDPFFDQHQAHLLVQARHQSTDPAARTALTRQAVALLERSLRPGVHEEYAHFNLGWLLLDLSDPAAAARHFTAAARLVPDKGGVYFGLGLALLEQERLRDAVRAFALEAINDPRSLTSPAWEIPALSIHLPAVHQEIVALYARLRGEFPAAETTEAWTRWWSGDPAVPDTALRPHNAESAAFLAALPAMRRKEALGGTPPFGWAALYAAWRAAPGGGHFTAVARDEPKLADALRRRATTFPDDFPAFLHAPVGEEPALLATYRRARPGYGFLARHPEGPFLTDVHVVQENRAVSTFAAGLFPRKGWIPGRFLLALLPGAAR